MSHRYLIILVHRQSSSPLEGVTQYIVRANSPLHALQLLIAESRNTDISTVLLEMENIILVGRDDINNRVNQLASEYRSLGLDEEAEFSETLSDFTKRHNMDLANIFLAYNEIEFVRIIKLD